MKYLLAIMTLSLFGQAYAGLSCSAYLQDTDLTRFYEDRCQDLSDKQSLNAYLILTEASGDIEMSQQTTNIFTKMHNQHIESSKDIVCEEILFLSLNDKDQQELIRNPNIERNFQYKHRVDEEVNEICTKLMKAIN